MRLFFVLAVTGISSCAKLDLTFLSPSNEKSSGAAVDFFIEPEFDASGFDENSFGFVQDSTESTNELEQNTETSSQKENYVTQETNGFDQNHNFNSETGINLENADPQYVDTFDRSYHVEKLKNVGRNDNEEGPKSDQAQAAFERLARILRLDTENNGQVFSYSYKKDQSIPVSVQGVNSGVEFKGGFSYTGDDGKVYSIRITSEEDDFGPRGDDLPRPPSLSRVIRKTLAQNEPEEANGILDDANMYPIKYHRGKYANSEFENSRLNNFAYGNDMFGNGNNGNGFGDSNYNFNGFNPEGDETEGGAIPKKINIPTSFEQIDDDISWSIVTDAADRFPSNNQRLQIRNERLNDQNGNKNYGAGDEIIPLAKPFFLPFENQRFSPRNQRTNPNGNNNLEFKENVNSINKEYVPPLENQRFAPRNQRPDQNRNNNLEFKENLYSINNEYLPPDGIQQFVPRNQVSNNQNVNQVPNNQNVNENIIPEDDSGYIINAYFPSRHESQEFRNQRTKNKNVVAKEDSVLTSNQYIPPLESSGLSVRNQKFYNKYGNKNDVAYTKESYPIPVNNQRVASASYQRPERIQPSPAKMAGNDEDLETLLPSRDRSRGNLRFNKDGGPQLASNPGFRSYPALNFGGRSARKTIMEIISTEQPEEYQDNIYDTFEF